MHHIQKLLVTDISSPNPQLFSDLASENSELEKTCPHHCSFMRLSQSSVFSLLLRTVAGFCQELLLCVNSNITKVF
jgi:hypothetical protein